MSYQYTAEKFDTAVKEAEKNADFVAVDVERSFGLPNALYGLTIAAYVGFLAIMAIGFYSMQLNVVMAVCFTYLAMAFGVPMLWTKIGPDNAHRPLEWGHFVEHGIETWTGKIKAKDASAQVLILPVLILFWGIATVTIGAIVTG